MITEEQFQSFLQSYLIAALWASTTEVSEGEWEPLDKRFSVSDIHLDSVTAARKDCTVFLETNSRAVHDFVKLISVGSHVDPWASAGHDFWLTRNGHGTGYWDRGLGEIGEKLSDAARATKEVDLYVGEDRKLYFSNHEEGVG